MKRSRRTIAPLVAAVSAVLLVAGSSAHAAMYRATALVAATFTTGPAASATGCFSFVFDDSFLAGAAKGEQKDWPVSQFATSLNPIGDTTFTPANVEGYVFYNQGSLRQVLVGGVGPTVLDENSVGGNSNDLYISLLLKPNGQLDDTFGSPGSFVWSDTSEIAVYQGEIVAGQSSLTITEIPEPATAVLLAVADGIALSRLLGRPWQSARRAEQFTVVDHCRMLGGQSDP